MEVTDGDPLLFRCHTGHVSSPGILLVEGARLREEDPPAQECARQYKDARMRCDENPALVMSPPFPVES